MAEMKLKVEFDVHQFRLSQQEEQHMRDSLDALSRQVQNFPVADLHVHFEHNARSNSVLVKFSLTLPGTTLVTSETDIGPMPAFERCLNSVIENLKAYKDKLGNVAEQQGAEQGKHRELHANIALDAQAIDSAIAAGDYTAFRKATFPLEEDVGKLVGRWVQRYPDIEAQIGTKLQIADLVEEVFLLAFDSYAKRPADIAFGTWLQSLIDPAVKAVQQHPDSEMESISMARTAMAAEVDAVARSCVLPFHKEMSMLRTLVCLVPMFAFVVMPLTSYAQKKVDHPRLRAALHELREARKSLEAAKDSWPPGYKQRALSSTQDAIDSIRTILQVKDVDSFRGVDRDPDYYKRYADHQHLRAALHDLREAREELSSAKANVGKLRDRALDDIDVAIGDILTLIRYNKR